jgi:membrane protein implicated in regulation of membrane protease activity
MLAYLAAAVVALAENAVAAAALLAAALAAAVAAAAVTAADQAVMSATFAVTQTGAARARYRELGRCSPAGLNSTAQSTSLA